MLHSPNEAIWMSKLTVYGRALAEISGLSSLLNAAHHAVPLTTVFHLASYGGPDFRSVRATILAVFSRTAHRTLDWKDSRERIRAALRCDDAFIERCGEATYSLASWSQPLCQMLCEAYCGIFCCDIAPNKIVRTK